jgi:hypothetical protein
MITSYIKTHPEQMYKKSDDCGICNTTFLDYVIRVYHL